MKRKLSERKGLKDKKDAKKEEDSSKSPKEWYDLE